MTLSVVIPAHNAADTLAETLDSLLAQTRGDWQAIVVDDGSTDTTRCVADDYAGRDERFSLIVNDGTPEGVSAARNRGIAAATGRWLHFLDSDDTIEPRFVDRMVGTLESNRGAKVVYCGSRRITSAGRYGPSWSPTGVATFDSLVRDCPLVVHGVVLDRELVVTQGGFDTALRTSEDMDFFLRIARTGVAFLPVSEPLALYRMRQRSLSSGARAMLADTTLVIERAFDVDSRVVRPCERHASGADPAYGSKEMAQGLTALWFAAADIGEGGNGLDMLMALPDPGPDLVEQCRGLIVDGVIFGARRLPDELPHDDPAFVARVVALLHELERAARQPGLARHLQFLLEPEIFGPRTPTDRVAVEGSLLVRQNIARLVPITVDREIERVYVEFRSKGNRVGHIWSPSRTDLSARGVMQLAIRSVGLGALLRASGYLRRPAFWLYAVLAGARLGVNVAIALTHCRVLPLHSLRELAKVASAEAALALIPERMPASDSSS